MREFCDYGYLPKYCGAFLEGLAGTLPDPARVVEIGTGACCSLRRILIGLSYHEDAHVWTVDKRKLNIAKAMDNRFTDRYTAFKALSNDIAKEWKIPLDMVYIDGDHGYQDCLTDIMAWEPHLKGGGIMAFDDYGFEHDEVKVQEVVDDILFATPEKWRLIGKVGRFIAFEKFEGKTLDWHTKIAWLSRNEPLPMEAWTYLCLGLR